jgi:amino acid transporter
MGTTVHEQQKIGLGTAITIGVNAMIGSGIFTVPSVMATYVGPAGIIAYVFVVMAVLCMALSFARLAKLYPQEGSFYVYTKAWAGHTGGIIAAASYLLGLTVAMGLLVTVGGHYLARFFSECPVAYLRHGILVSLTLLTVNGVALSQLGQHILVVLTIFPLIATTIICFFHGSVANLIPFAPHGLGNIMKATRMVIFGFFGFEAASSLFPLVRNPEKNVPLALAYSVMCVGLLYIVFITSIILATPSSYFTNPYIPLSAILAHIVPQHQWLLVCIDISVLAAIIGTVHAMLWSSSTLLCTIYSLCHAGTKHIPSWVSVLVIACGIFITSMSISNLDLFFSLTAVGIVFAMILAMLGLVWQKSLQCGERIVTSFGLVTATIILFFAMQATVEQLMKIL